MLTIATHTLYNYGSKIKTKQMIIFKEEATSALAGFHAGYLEFEDLGFFLGKPENPDKNPRSKEKTNNKLKHGTWSESKPSHICG